LPIESKHDAKHCPKCGSRIPDDDDSVLFVPRYIARVCPPNVEDGSYCLVECLEHTSEGQDHLHMICLICGYFYALPCEDRE
jgi:hypothetical protein